MTKPNIDIDTAAECARLLDNMRERIQRYERFQSEFGVKNPQVREEAIMYGTAATAILGLEHFRI